METNGNKPVEDATDYDSLTQLVEKKKAQQKRFVAFEERRDEHVLKREAVKVVCTGRSDLSTSYTIIIIIIMMMMIVMIIIIVTMMMMMN